ncbi:MAG: hypothetical protein JWQ40_1990 [Segetibacter sp.]|nr:hypothetical protein [Segetibacter sp.]
MLLRFNWDDCCLQTSMKRIITCWVVFFLLSKFTIAQSSIVAEIRNLENDKGVCRACLFNNPASFKGETGNPFQCVAVPVKNLIAQAVFTNIPAGTYALFVFHDENSNNKIDKNFIGIPKEGYGASKNKLPFAGAPTYDENKFVVDNKATVKLLVKIRNL